MIFLIFFSLIIISTVTASSIDRNLDTQWENYKNFFDKSYEADEDMIRRLIWEQNVAEITKHNLESDLGMHSYTLGINSFSDLTRQEIESIVNCYTRRNRTSSRASLFLPSYDVQLPSTVDWREKGFVTPMKDQRECGSCYAFSTTGSLEGQYKKKTGKLVSFSEQNLVDCSRKQGNDGCIGGQVYYAYDYIRVNGGIDTESSYPYEGKEDACRFNNESIGTICTGYVDIRPGDESDLKFAVATIGPISISIDATGPKFIAYKSGIYDNPDCTTTKLVHALLLIGYGTEDGKDYWLVKNSWGENWGMKGYGKMSRNKGNQCGIASEGIYPLV